MRLYLLRHAEAVPGTPDASRDLTAHGQRQVALLAKGAGRAPLEEVDAIEHSPLVRAVRTAQLLRLATGSPLPLKVLGGLEPEHDPRKTAAQLGKSRRSRLLVGHNPHLAELAALLLGLPDGGAAVGQAQQQGRQLREVRVMPDQQAAAARLAELRRRLARIVLRLQPAQHLERQRRARRQPQQLGRAHRADERAVLDRVDFFERRPARALGEQGDLALPVRGEVTRRIRRPGDGFGMTEQIETHPGKVGPK